MAYGGPFAGLKEFFERITDSQWQWISLSVMAEKEVAFQHQKSTSQTKYFYIYLIEGTDSYYEVYLLSLF